MLLMKTLHCLLTDSLCIKIAFPFLSLIAIVFQYLNAFFTLDTNSIIKKISQLKILNSRLLPLVNGGIIIHYPESLREVVKFEIEEAVFQISGNFLWNLAADKPSPLQINFPIMIIIGFTRYYWRRGYQKIVQLSQVMNDI